MPNFFWSTIPGAREKNRKNGRSIAGQEASKNEKYVKEEICYYA